MKKKRWPLVSLLALLAPLQVLAQQAQGEVEMADALRAEGKIYVVVVVILIVVLGLCVFAFRLDKKVSDLEKKIDADHEA